MRNLFIFIDRSESEMISLYFDSLLRNNPDVTLVIIHSLLSMRSDLTSSQIAEALEGCQKIIDKRDPSLPVEAGEHWCL